MSCPRSDPGVAQRGAALVVVCLPAWNILIRLRGIQHYDLWRGGQGLCAPQPVARSLRSSISSAMMVAPIPNSNGVGGSILPRPISQSITHAGVR